MLPLINPSPFLVSIHAETETTIAMLAIAVPALLNFIAMSWITWKERISNPVRCISHRFFPMTVPMDCLFDMFCCVT